MNIAVLGSGAWGTSLARLLLSANGSADRATTVTLWSHIPEYQDEIRQTGRNERFLPGIELPKELRMENNLGRAVSDAECVLVAVPSQPFREVTSSLAGFGGLVVSVTKGIEYDSGLTMCGVLA